jgi:hypothetical protein
MLSKILPVLLLVAFTAGCSVRGLTPSLNGVAQTQSGPSDGGLSSARKRHHFVYWTLFASCSYPQLQYAAVPLHVKSKAKNLDCTSKNGLSESSALHVDPSGRLWVIVFGPYSGDPGAAEVFKLPLKPTSVPELLFGLKGTSDPDHLTFDASGNLWVSSHNQGVTEYKGPFKKSGILSPALTLTDGISRPAGLALDKKGNLYVANFIGSAGTAIAVFKAPISKKHSYYLTGITQPGGLIFDKSGDLYASMNGPSQYGIVRYDSDNLGSGATPNIVDSTRLSVSYESDFAFSSTGDLYFANCGSTANIYGYPTGKKKFSSKLAPSVDFTDAQMQQAGCAWGIAIK